MKQTISKTFPLLLLATAAAGLAGCSSPSPEVVEVHHYRTVNHVATVHHRAPSSNRDPVSYPVINSYDRE